jgi:hypothetical protein
LDFYRGAGTDSAGRRLDDMLAWSDENWEMWHDFIQWVFPLKQRSQFNADAPILTDEDVRAFCDDGQLQSRLQTSLARFLRFLGLSLVEHDGQVSVEPGEDFERKRELWRHPNHNWLRVTRALLSLKILGQQRLSRAFFAFLETQRWHVTEETFRYWSEAAGVE